MKNSNHYQASKNGAPAETMAQKSDLRERGDELYQHDKSKISAVERWARKMNVD
jgi:hypothetical protein